MEVHFHCALILKRKTGTFSFSPTLCSADVQFCSLSWQPDSSQVCSKLSLGPISQDAQPRPEFTAPHNACFQSKMLTAL